MFREGMFEIGEITVTDPVKKVEFCNLMNMSLISSCTG